MATIVCKKMVRKLFLTSSSINNSGHKKNSSSNDIQIDLDPIIKIGTAKNVTLIIKWLESNNAIKEEGIFRVNGNSAIMEEVKKNFSLGKDDLSHFTISDAYSIAGCLKFILREFPEPLFTWNFYPIFIKIETNNQLNDIKRLFFLKMLVHALPVANRTLTLTLLSFLYKFSLVTENKMSALNLATVFAPNILRPKEENISQLMNNSDSINTIKTLIEEYSFISNSTKYITSNPDLLIPRPLPFDDSLDCVLVDDYLIAIAHMPQQQNSFKKGLSFKAGDKINILDLKCDGQFIGELNGTIGYVPSSYIDIIDISQGLPGSALSISSSGDSQKLCSSSFKINGSPSSLSPHSYSPVLSSTPSSSNFGNLHTLQRTNTSYFTSKPSLSLSQPISKVTNPINSNSAAHHALSMGTLPPNRELPPLPSKPPPLTIPSLSNSKLNVNSANISNCATSSAGANGGSGSGSSTSSNGSGGSGNVSNYPYLSNRSQSSMFFSSPPSSSSSSTFPKFSSPLKLKSKSAKNSPVKQPQQHMSSTNNTLKKSTFDMPPIITTSSNNTPLSSNRVLNYSYSSFSLTNNSGDDQSSNTNFKSFFDNIPPSRTQIPILPPKPPPLNIPQQQSPIKQQLQTPSPPQSRPYLTNRSATSMLLNKLPPPPIYKQI